MKPVPSQIQNINPGSHPAARKLNVWARAVRWMLGLSGSQFIAIDSTQAAPRVSLKIEEVRAAIGNRHMIAKVTGSSATSQTGQWTYGVQALKPTISSGAHADPPAFELADGADVEESDDLAALNLYELENEASAAVPDDEVVTCYWIDGVWCFWYGGSGGSSHIWIKITGSLAFAGTINRWKYAFTQVDPTDGSTISGGETGITGDDTYAVNVSEYNNPTTETGVLASNQVDQDHFSDHSSTFALYPIRANRIVKAVEYDGRWCFEADNYYGGDCSA